MNNFRDKTRGMLVGLVVGDVLGAPVQFGASSAAIRERVDRLRDFHDNQVLPKGVYTDDTSMALCIADSLLERGGYDSYDVMEKYCSWENGGYRSYFDYGYDVGGQVDRAICDYAKDPVVPKDAERAWNAGNGCIMRLAPTVIAAAKTQTLEQTVRLAWVSGRETHYSEVAEMATQVFANLLYRALKMRDKAKIVALGGAMDSGDLYFTEEKFREAFLDNRWMIGGRIESDGECLRDLGGYVIDALTIAIWGFTKFDDFETGMLEVLKLGGDTDTNCAIYGQLAGAYYGLKAIPERWRTGMTLSEEALTELADKLLDMSECPILATRFEEDENA